MTRLNPVGPISNPCRTPRGKTSMIPRKRKRPKMGLKERPQIRSLRHLRFVRARNCAIMGKQGTWADAIYGYHLIHICSGPIQAAHIRTRTDGGMKVKPSDCFTIPLCVNAHAEQHQIGEPAFEKRYGISMRKIADALWQADVQSRMEWERKHAF